MKYISFLMLCMVLSCSSSVDYSKLDIQGHRGCRGLLPENTIPAFIKALEYGVSTIELDVIISGDGQVVVSHEAYMNHEICTKPNGEAVKIEEESKYNLYGMSIDSIQTFDVGMKLHPRFSEQEKIKVVKPLLISAIDSIEDYIKKHSIAPIQYNIEIKSTKMGDDRFHPKPYQFVELVMGVVSSKGLENRTIIQSFDFRVLKVMNELYPEMPCAALIETDIAPQEILDKLGFKPEVYSPDYKLITKEWLSFCKNEKIKLIPWTVNSKKDLEKVLKMGVDGIITDYPNRLVEVLASLQVK